MTVSADIDLDHLSQWIGRREEAQDVITPGLVQRYRATFGDWLLPDSGDAPPGLHWCLSPAAVAQETLGPDGHPARGGFLPPVPYENRMWAGGAITFCAPLRVGDTVRRVSSITAITPRQGRSGPLLFVSVNHRHMVGDETRIDEQQDIVYRPAGAPSPVAPPVASPPDAAIAGAFVADPVMLFRYSAMTFNGHRIHYDHPYVTGTEGYPGLVVHGPLQASLLMNAAMRKLGTAAIRTAYRGISPLIAGQPVRLQNQGERYWLEKPDGTVTFEMRAHDLNPAEEMR